MCGFMITRKHVHRKDYAWVKTDHWNSWSSLERWLQFIRDKCMEDNAHDPTFPWCPKCVAAVELDKTIHALEGAQP